MLATGPVGACQYAGCCCPGLQFQVLPRLVLCYNLMNPAMHLGLSHQPNYDTNHSNPAGAGWNLLRIVAAVICYACSVPMHPLECSNACLLLGQYVAETRCTHDSVLINL
eukprot:GHUV01026847.1.p1 GENE.GHUV01026847.1~~GHUV01026847.1.p1  ORF type:complete len:110 (+),score=10.61 GHUV01026847.1:908-1237(+)